MDSNRLAEVNCNKKKKENEALNYFKSVFILLNFTFLIYSLDYLITSSELALNE